MTSLRNATWEDAKFLFDLKNDKTVRKFSIVTQKKIKWEDHLEWYKKNMQYTYIIEWNGERCGDIRIKNLEIAIKLDPKFRGLGIGSDVLHLVTDKYGFLTAKIVDGNVPSMKLFTKYGFKVIDHKDNYYILSYEANPDRLSV